MISSPGIKVLEKEETKTIFGNSAVERLYNSVIERYMDAPLCLSYHIDQKGGYGKHKIIHKNEYISIDSLLYMHYSNKVFTLSI